MEQTITCIGVGCYEMHLTRGEQYTLISHDTDKNQVRIQGDSGHTRWFPAGWFDLTGKESVPVLVSWKFANPVVVEGVWLENKFIEPYDETCNCVNVVV